MVFDARHIWESPQLPVLSAVGKKLIDLSRSSESTVDDLLQALQADAAFSAELIGAANTPLCSATAQCETTSQAVEHLGPAAVTFLGISLAVRDCNLAAETASPQVIPCWRQMVVKAVAAEVLCKRVNRERAHEAFVTGLLLDVGRLVLLRTVNEKYSATLEKASHDHRPAWQVEQAELGMNSARIGAQLLEQWGLEARVIHDVQNQFSPLSILKQQLHGSDHPSAGIAALASAIGDYFCCDERALAWFRIRELAAEVLPVSELQLAETLREISARFTEVAPALSVGEPTLPALEALKASVIEQLRPIHRRTDGPGPSERGPSAAATTERHMAGSAATAEKRKSFRDPLTQVYTSEFFEETLHHEVQRCRQNASPLGVAFVQIDRFEKLVQQFGDSFRDVVLQRLGGILKELLRTSDSIARFEYQFAIMASDPTAKGMQRLADRIRGRVASEQLMWSGQRVLLTVSVGSTLALPGRKDEMMGARVLAAAQKAVTEAAMGEGNNIYFESLVAEIELQRLFMSNQLRFSRWLISRGVLDIPRVGKALLEYKQRQMRLGDLALRQELLSQTEVDQILEEQAASDARFGDVAVRRDLLTEDQLIGLLILQQEDPLSVAELFLRRSILTEEDLQSLLKEYFAVVPWAAPLYPTAGNG